MNHAHMYIYVYVYVYVYVHTHTPIPTFSCVCVCLFSLCLSPPPFPPPSLSLPLSRSLSLSHTLSRTFLDFRCKPSIHPLVTRLCAASGQGLLLEEAPRVVQERPIVVDGLTMTELHVSGSRVWGICLRGSGFSVLGIIGLRKLPVVQDASRLV